MIGHPAGVRGARGEGPRAGRLTLDEVLRASPACRWTLNVRCDDPLELFPTHMIVAGT